MFSHLKRSETRNIEPLNFSRLMSLFPFLYILYIYIYIYIYIYHPFSKRFSYREIYRYIYILCSFARAPVCIFHLLLSNLWKTRFNDKFFRRRVFCSNLTCHFELFCFFLEKYMRPAIQICNGELYSWFWEWGKHPAKQPIRELYGVTELVGQMLWHL